MTPAVVEEWGRFWPAARLLEVRLLEGCLRELEAPLLLRASDSRWERRALAFSRLISCISGQKAGRTDDGDAEPTMFLTCSGVRGALGRTPGLEGAVCGGDVEGRSVILTVGTLRMV